MTFAQKLAVHIAPIFLRLVLGITFLWAGLGKVLTDIPVTSENAPALVRMKAIPQSQALHLLPPGFTIDAPSENVSTPTPDENPPPENSEPPADPPADPPENPGQGDGFFNDPETTPPEQGDGGNDPGGSAALEPTLILVQDSTPADLAVKGLYGVSLAVVAASSESTDADGKTKSRLIPEFAGKGEMPKYLGWAAAISEIFAGGFLLIGFMTRISALAVVGVMGVAIWLTNIGPAAMGHLDHTVLGILPGPGPDGSIFDPALYTQLGWQLALLAGGLTLLFAGAGTLSLDRLLFGSGPGDLDDD